MNTWKVILATLVIFAAGVVTGSLTVKQSSRWLGWQHQHAAGEARPATGFAGGMRLDFLRRAQRELDLTPEQRQQIDQILKDSQEHTRKVMEPIAPELRQELHRTKEAFRAALTPEQRARFDDMLKRQRAHEPHRGGQERQTPVPEGGAVTNSI
jgi:Spy/CpxP family protein refolding chaperone